jgi:hypothetical protein
MSTTNDPSIYKEGSESIESGPTSNSFGIDEEDPSKNVDNQEDTRTKGFVVIVAIAAALGGLIFGYGEYSDGILWFIDKVRFIELTEWFFLCNRHRRRGCYFPHGRVPPSFRMGLSYRR